MKASIFHETGDVEVLKYEEIDTPSIGDNDVLVNVKASTLNSLDLKLRAGTSPRPVELPHIGGIDISGQVESTGSGVSNVAPGDRVVVNPTVRLEKGFSVVGVNQHGGFAEYVSVPASNVVKIPDSLSFDDASTLPVCYVTAIYGLINRGGLKSGDTVVVHAAGSGTGSAAIEVAKHFGAKVIATAGSDEKLEKAKELGADQVINYKSADFSEEIKGGVDVIFDQVGAGYWDKNIKILKPGGKLLLIGVVGGAVVEKAMLGPLIMRDISVIGVTMFNAPNSVLEEAVKLAGEGNFKPAIFKKFPLSENHEAQKVLQESEQFGKVIINP